MDTWGHDQIEGNQNPPLKIKTIRKHRHHIPNDFIPKTFFLRKKRNAIFILFLFTPNASFCTNILTLLGGKCLVHLNLKPYSL